MVAWIDYCRGMSSSFRNPVVLFALLALGFSASCDAFPAGGRAALTRVTLTAVTADAQPPSAADMDTARTILASRLADAGFGKAEVVLSGQSQIVISVPGRRNIDEFRPLAARAQVAFRKVLRLTDGGAANAEPAASMPGNVSRDQVEAKLGQAMEVARTLTAPASDPATLSSLKPFAQLTPAEVAVLTPEVQFNVPQIACLHLGARPVGAPVDPSRRFVACQGQAKYYLDVAKVTGADLAGAEWQGDRNSGRWDVLLKFDADGAQKWTSLTREAFTNGAEPKCDSSALGDQQHCLVAIVLDNTIISAPEILGVLTDVAQISGSFTEKTATALATQLNNGPLPVAFEIQDVTVVDPSQRK